MLLTDRKARGAPQVRPVNTVFLSLIVCVVHLRERDLGSQVTG